jgi:hypothetical protein
MTVTTRKLAIVSIAVGIASAAVLAQPIWAASSEQSPATEHVMPDHHQIPNVMPHHDGSMTETHGLPPANAMPTMPGQDAFGAIQEIVRILEANPNTDWSKVNLEALRQHLIDMNEVTLKANATAKPIEGGLEITVKGSGRTLVAIQRMVPAHAPMIDGHNGWHVKAALLPDGALLTVTADDAKEVAHIRGLGFIGVMATGAHHQPHHLAIAEGKRPMHTY